MKTADVPLCWTCKEEVLRPSQLIFKKIPNTYCDEPVCAFCKQKRITNKYRIQYGRKP